VPMCLAVVVSAMASCTIQLAGCYSKLSTDAVYSINASSAHTGSAHTQQLTVVSAGISTANELKTAARMKRQCPLQMFRNLQAELRSLSATTKAARARLPNHRSHAMSAR
jgi:hypothetical protein